MAIIDGATIDEKFARFSIFQRNYKTVGDHAIRADLIIPKSIKASNGASTIKAPVIIQIHGGGLVFGDSLYTPWFPSWILDLAVKHNAIIVSPNYRLLPEATGVDILTDMDDFWKWLHSNDANITDESQSLSSVPIQLDLDRVITTGESAGGLLSVYLALTFPDEIRSATAGYPMFNQEGMIGSSGVQLSAEQKAQATLALKTYVDNLKPGAVASTATDDSRGNLSGLIVTHTENLTALYERDADQSPIHRERLFQLKRLDKPDTRLPKGGLVVLHGKQDGLVPMNLSERFVDAAREKLKGRQGIDRLVLSVQDGEHGFDNDVSLDCAWLQDAIQTAVEVWLE